jgi:uncharacterized membrane-anchored protein YhcB (DUF1043 family)
MGNDNEPTSNSQGSISYKHLAIIGTLIGSIAGTLGTQLGRSDPFTGTEATRLETRLNLRIDKVQAKLDSVNTGYSEHLRRPHEGVQDDIKELRRDLQKHLEKAAPIFFQVEHGAK